MRTADDLVRVEVHYCISSLVSTLASTPLPIVSQEGNDVVALCGQAQELGYPIEDWEEAAREAGWSEDDHEISRPDGDSDDEEAREFADSWQDACDAAGVEPYQREIYEHWIVSDWLADKLAENGEKVDTDFAGLTVWARTTTGQAISMDSVIQKIVADLNGTTAEG